MSDLHDHNPGGDLVFPGELEGTEFRLQDTALYEYDDGEPQNGSPPDVIEGEPKFGKWLFVQVDGEPQLLAAPGELIAELQRLDASEGQIFRVTRCEKSGEEQSANYEVNVETGSEA